MNIRIPTPSSSRSGADLLPNEQQISYDSVHRFFEQNRLWIGVLSVVVILGVLGVVGWRFQEDQLRRQANTRLAAAYSIDSETYSIDSLRAITRDFPGTDAALIATMTLANVYFQQEQWDQAVGCYQTIVDRYPSSPFLSSALIGLAAIAETKGKTKEAIHGYQSIATHFPDSFQAPQAQFSLARLQERNGQFQEARKTYEELIVKYPKSSWGKEAAARLQKLTRIFHGNS